MPYLVSIVGPTASGKSALAVNLSKNLLHVPIISADSVQVYAGLVIGSGVIPKEERQGVAHYMLNIYEPTFDHTAADFSDSVNNILSFQFESKEVAIMVGGSGLYLQAIWEGFDDIPRIDQEVRQQLNEEFKEYGLERLVEELRQVDVETWNQIDRKNPARVIRALEVYRGTHQPISFYRGKRTTHNNAWEDVKIGLEWDRQALYQRIEARVDQMMAEGWVEEVKEVAEKYGINCKGLNRSLGYRELVSYLKGETDLDTAVALIKQNTRRFAKRQMTWFKRFPDIRWFPPSSEKEIEEYVKFRCGL